MALRRKASDGEVRAPSAWLLMNEVRAVLEYARLRRLQRRLVDDLPRGDGHPVLVIPGFGAGEKSTEPLRDILARLGYAVHDWGQGRNLGMNRVIRHHLRAMLPALHREHGARLSLIGWSLGGVFARELARHQPDHVRRVITLGSPINVRPDATNVDWLARALNPSYSPDMEAFRKRCQPPLVPCTAIYSRRDGIVAWQTSMENEAPNTENVEVNSTHTGLALNPKAIRVIAERLAQPVSDRAAA